MVSSGIISFFLLLEIGLSSTQSSVSNLEYAKNVTGSLSKPKFKMDTAWLTINSTVGFDIRLYSLNDECYKCPFVFVTNFPSHNLTTILVNTTFGTSISLRRVVIGQSIEEEVCRLHNKFRESGDYWIFVNYAAYTSGYCELLMTNDPLPAEMPILYVFVVLLVLGVILKVILYLYRRKERSGFADITEPHASNQRDIQLKKLHHMNNVPEGNYENVEDTGREEKETKPVKKRLKSLDTFRGLSLVVMMFVNYGGGGYWFFEHPPWNGLTVADLVFPWFIFIMGTAMNYSFRSMMRRGKSFWRMLLKILKRSFLLFAIGIILNTNWGPVDLKKLRIPGVLQRFSLTYLVIALMELFFARKEDSHQNSCWSGIRDIVLYLHEWLIALAILAAHLALTFALPIDNGCPTGYLGPGGLSEGGKFYNCTGGAASYIDRMVLTSNHIYNNPTPKKIYQTVIAHDPEGILGVLTSIFLCFLGLQTGRILITYKGHASRIVRWIIWAIITGGVGTLLCKASQNEGWIPLNKNLWSVSFILITASFANILLAFMYVIIDILQWWDGDPFVFPGMNSIVVYCCHDIFYRFFPVNWQLEEIVHWRLLCKAVWDCAIWIVLAYILFRKKIFIAL